MARYGKKAQEKVAEAMHEFKHGELHSGKSGKPVTNPKQAVAIGLSEARKAGAKVPRGGPGAGTGTSAHRQTSHRKA